jgi:hypothetical protein
MVEDGYTLYLSFGDISSFSNSCVNSWVLVLALLLMILTTERLKHFREPIQACVNGVIMTFTLPVVLITYLYLTVGIPADTPTGPHVAPGGYLGVKGNMVLTTFAFATILEEVETKMVTLFPAVRFLLIRIGGDDFFFALIAPVDYVVLEALKYIRNQIIMYVGKLKDFDTTVIPLNIDGTYSTTQQYCKKYVRVEVACISTGGSRIHAQSEQKIPFFGELIELELMPTEKARRSQLAKFTKSCRTVLSGYNDELILLNSFHRAFCTSYLLPNTVSLQDTHYWVAESDIIFEKNICMTHRAAIELRSLPSLYDSTGRRYRYTSKMKRSVLLSLECLESNLVHVAPLGSMVELVAQKVLDVRVLRPQRFPSFTIKVDDNLPEAMTVHDVMAYVRLTLQDLLRITNLGH